MVDLIAKQLVRPGSPASDEQVTLTVNDTETLDPAGVPNGTGNSPAAQMPVIQGFLRGDVDLSGNNSWGDALASGLFGQLSEAALKLQQAAGFLGGDVGERAFFKVESLIQTQSVWTGSKRFFLTLDIRVAEIDDDDNTLATAVSALRTTYPRAVEGAEIPLLKPPANYRPPQVATASNVAASRQQALTGGINVQIGTYFRTPAVFVADDAKITLSRIVADTGRPLYADLSIALRSYRMVTIQEIYDWIDLDPGGI